MANGKARQKRIEAVNLICVGFNSSIDMQAFLETGIVSESCKGKPIKLTPEQEHAVQEEIEKIRRENPNLPQVAAIK